MLPVQDEAIKTLRNLREFSVQRRRKAAAHAVALLGRDYLPREIDGFIAQTSDAQRDIEMLDRALADEEGLRT